MSKLAEYIKGFAGLVGSKESVYFQSVESGSTVLNAVVREQAVPEIRQRLELMRFEADSEAAELAHKFDETLRRDGTSAVLEAGNDWRMPFPGSNVADLSQKVRQHDSLQGRLVRIGGKDSTAHAQIDTGNAIERCSMTRTIARKMAPYLFGPSLRLHGDATWERSHFGPWRLNRFRVESFDILEDIDFGESLRRLRESEQSAWDDINASDFMEEMRHGEKSPA